jgi:hypothetical protein
LHNSWQCKEKSPQATSSPSPISIFQYLFPYNPPLLQVHTA